MRVVITQSNYIPWKGYFDAIGAADLLILYDDMQFTKRDWRNRNKIKTKDGLQWLTIPVETRHRFYQSIRETKITSATWQEKHFKTIAQAYALAPCFREYRDLLASWYSQADSKWLSEVNYFFITNVCKFLKIETRIRSSSEFELKDGKTNRLVELCKQIGATEYLTGPSARAYIDHSLFEQAGIAVRYMDYSWYPEYAQLHGEFIHQVSITDMIFNLGRYAPRYALSSYASQR